MKKRQWIGIIAGAGLLTIVSCSNNANKANLLDPAVKYQSDTMLSHRHGVLNRQLDTLCFTMMDSLVAIYADSLVKQQTDQIDAILGRSK